MITHKPVIRKPGENGPPTDLELDGHMEFTKIPVACDFDFRAVRVFSFTLSIETIHNATALGRIQELKDRILGDFKTFLEGEI